MVSCLLALHSILTTQQQKKQHIVIDVIQEVASRGMGLVYDMSDSSQKEALVGMLVGTLLEGRKYVNAVCVYM